MTNLERRQSPRTAITGHAYVNIEPNNGGIVLNVSDGGLCFHSFDPVQRNGKVRFWFSDRNRRIEAQATLAWTDETQKAGLQFTALPAEGREQIRKWMLQSATPVAGAAPSNLLPPRAFPSPVGGAETKVAPDHAPLGVVSTKIRVRTQLSGFSRGLLTGVLVSAVVAAAFLFQAYRGELGETLIRLGERFAAKPQTQSVVAPAPLPVAATTGAVASPSPAPQGVLPAAPILAAAPAKSSAEPKKLVTAPNPPARQPEKISSPPPANPAPPQPVKLEPAKAAPTEASTTVVAAVKAPVLTSAPASSSPPLTAVSAPAPVAPGSSPASSKAAQAPKIEQAKPPELETETSAAENAASTSQMYFDVGKFKNQSQAHVQMDKLSQLGFPTTAVQKGFLWTNSYHILVGPYSDEERAKVTHQNLLSSGFKPRPFERGSRPFTLGSTVTLNGARTPAGDYIISWESSLDDASVKLLHNDYVVASGNARWVKRDVKYSRDAYVYRRNADGSRLLIEIRFGGTRQALVFGKS